MTDLTSDDVSDYLRQNPEFFSQNPDLITDLEAEGTLPPFHERQLVILRQRHRAEQEKYRMVVDSARNNLALEQSLHQFARDLLLLRSDQSGRFQAPLERKIETSFELIRCRLLLLADVASGVENNDDYGLIAPRVAHGSSICDDRVSSTLLSKLFGEQNSIASCAFVPLADANNEADLIGVMVFGASEVNRFQPGMGAIYLDRIGQLAAAFLQGRS